MTTSAPLEQDAKSAPTIGNVEHLAGLLADVIRLADYLITESDAPKSITDLHVSLVMVARDMSSLLVTTVSDYRKGVTQ